MGELLKELARANIHETGYQGRMKQLGLSDGGTTPSPYATALSDNGMSRPAVNVRLRAERRVGELLKELARATPEEVAQAGGFAKAAASPEATKQSISEQARCKG